MNGYDGHAHAIEPQAKGTDEHKNALLEHGRQTPAEAGDLTPTPSRTTTPFQVGKSTSKKSIPTTKGVGTKTTVANGTDASVPITYVDPSKAIDPLHVSSPRGAGHIPLSKSTVYVSRSPSSLSSPLPSRSLTPKHSSARPAASDGICSKDMSDSAPNGGSLSGPSRPTPARQQQPQPQPPQHEQRTLQSYGYYTSPPPSEPSFIRKSPSSSNQSGHPSFAHTQQPTTVQRPGFVGQYTLSPSPSSLYPQHQVQHPYAYPQLNIPVIPPLAHTHSHTPPEFYPVGHSASPGQRPLYAPPFHTSVSHEHPPTFDHDRSGNAVRSPTVTASSPYSQQQPFTAFNFHPTMTATPQFTHSHSPFSSPFPAQQTHHAHRPQYPPTYSYMTRSTPNTPEDASHSPQQPSTAWWYIPPHGASPNTGPYPSMYYVDAYGNPSNSGPGPGLPALTSPSSRPMHGLSFSRSDPTISTPSENGSGATAGGPQRPIRESSRSESVVSPLARPSTSSTAFGASVSEHGTPEQQQTQSKQSIRRPHLPNPPVQRSEWVMWVGNVPSDATYDELWRFFTGSMSRSVPLSNDVHPTYRRQQQQLSHLPAGLLSPSDSSSASDANSDDISGVQSVFLIARSNCAFVNFVSEVHLTSAIQRFNGIPLRPSDLRCPRLVCRVRGKEEDLKAGVGAQRGTGIHTRWVREREERERQESREQGELTDTETSISEPPETPSSVVMTESGTDVSTQSSGRAPQHSSSSGSTTSGFLSRYFPKRYFILKSLSQYDLDLSVEKGVWATQSHNEAVLNQAFRNSSDVYLIFSVNKSGEFYGYARMASPIGKAAADRISWASRTDSGHSQHSHSPAASFASSAVGKGSHVTEVIPEESEGSSPESKEISGSKGDERGLGEDSRPLMLFSPSEHRLAENSPQPVTPATQKRLSTAQESENDKVPSPEESSSASPPIPRSGNKIPQSAGTGYIGKSNPPTSAPAVMGAPHHRMAASRLEGLSSETLDPRLLRRRQPELHLDPEAPYRAIRQEPLSSGEQSVVEDADRIKRRDTFRKSREVDEDRLQQSPDAGSASQAEHGDHTPQWGTPFKVQWIRTERMPFSRTRHLRNPWNHEREVKVSRDGTELEPSVGQALLDEWDKEEPLPPPQALSTSGAGGGVGGRRGPHYRRTKSQTQVSTVHESDPGSGNASPQPRQQKSHPR